LAVASSERGVDNDGNFWRFDCLFFGICRDMASSIMATCYLNLKCTKFAFRWLKFLPKPRRRELTALHRLLAVFKVPASKERDGKRR